MAVHGVVELRTGGEIIGASPLTVRLRAEISRAARFGSSVLITGPSGSGKELVARRLHAESPRARGAFIPVDCASIAGELMSSQLFGHVAGAFTGAAHDALGCFRAANQGTLFLDEIGELEYAMQAKLLRVLQEHEVTPVGSHRSEKVDVRVIAATNRELRTEVLAGRFREDLYYRLDVVHLRTTALCERREDIPLLAKAFLAELAGEGLPACDLAAGALDVLVRFDWPGNVRQLRNVLEQAVIESCSSTISASLVRKILMLSIAGDSGVNNRVTGPAGAGATSSVAASGGASLVAAGAPRCAASGEKTREDWPTLRNVERDHLRRTLEHTFYNRSAAARLLGLTRQSLLRKMKQYGL